jgi:hypothetical protein
VCGHWDRSNWQVGNRPPIEWEHIDLTGDYTWHANRRVAEGRFRRLMAKFEKIIVDVQAASPSSWKTTCMAVRMIS